jgi:hypothetical protein
MVSGVRGEISKSEDAVYVAGCIIRIAKAARAEAGPMPRMSGKRRRITRMAALMPKTSANPRGALGWSSALLFITFMGAISAFDA